MIEVTTFRLRRGTDPGAFSEADARYQTGFSYQQPGLRRRTTAVDEDGGWLVLELWRSPGDADAAALARRGSTLAGAWDASIDPGSVDVRRYETLD